MLIFLKAEYKILYLILFTRKKCTEKRPKRDTRAVWKNPVINASMFILHDWLLSYYNSCYVQMRLMVDFHLKIFKVFSHSYTLKILYDEH